MHKIHLAAMTVLLTISTAGAQDGSFGYWRFEEGLPDAQAVGDGSILDSSASADHGTPGGDPFYRTDVATASVAQTDQPNTLSLELDGTDSVFFSSKFPFHDSVDATLEFWIKIAETGHRALFWTRPDSLDTNRFNIFVHYGNIGFDYRSPSGVRHVLVDHVTGQMVWIGFDVWTHVAITRSGNEYRLYVNGNLERTVVDENPDLPTSVGWSVAGRSLVADFAGNVDEIRLTDEALSPSRFLYSQPPLECFDDGTVGGLYSGDLETLLLLHFENRFSGEDGEEPLSTTDDFSYGRLGNGFNSGPEGSGAFPDWLVYDLTGNIDLNAGTLEFWFRPDWNGNDNEFHNLITAYTGSDNVNSLWLTKDGGNNLVFGTHLEDRFGAGALAANVADWRAGEWHHIALRWDRDHADLHIDGTLRALTDSLEMPSSMPFLSLSGRPADVSGRGPDGVIDELRISGAPRCVERLAIVFSSVGPEGGRLSSLLTEPAGLTVLVGSHGGGVFRSRDAGRGWVDASPGIPQAQQLHVNALVRTDSASGTLLASTGQGLIKSDDGGDTWTTTGLSGGWVEVVTVDANDPTVFSAATQNGACYESAGSGPVCDGAGVLRSTDSGETWEKVTGTLPSDFVIDLAQDHDSSAALYAVVGDGWLYRTDDGGATWTDTGVFPATSVWTSPELPGSVFAGSVSGFFRSGDSGATWEQPSTDLDGRWIVAFHTDGSRMWAGSTDGTLWWSDDQGDFWTPASATGLLSVEYIASGPTDDPGSPDGTVVYAVGRGGAALSLDRGATWRRSNDGIRATQIWALAYDSDAEVLYAGTWNSGIFRSPDHGLTWEAFNANLPPLEIWVLAVGPDPAGFGNTLYAGLNCGGVWRYDTVADSWASINTGFLAGQVMDMRFDTAKVGVVYGATQDGGVFKSLDLGDNWEAANVGLPEPANGVCMSIVSEAVPTPSTVYLGTPFDGLFRSTDDGATWHSSSTGITDSIVTDIAYDASDPAVLYAGTFSGRIFKSTDGGVFWNEGDQGFNGGAVQGIEIDSGTGTIFTASRFWGGVQMSTDDGGWWDATGPGIKQESLPSLKVVPGAPSLIFAGTEGTGVYLAEVSGQVLLPPTAAFSFAPSAPVEGDTVLFDASSSSDPDDGIVAYEWDLDGDGAFDDATGVGASRVFPEDGVYQVGLAVRDASGKSDTTSSSVVVGNSVPNAAFTGPTAVFEGSEAVFDPSPSFDPGNDIVLYEWDFGDGTVVVNAGTGDVQSHRYADDGSFVVTLRVVDDDGASSVMSQGLTVFNVPPVALAAVSTDTPVVGNRVVFDGSGSYASETDLLTHRWVMGDGSAGSGTVLTHTYTQPGGYIASLTVRDDDGSEASAAVPITVGGPEPGMIVTIAGRGETANLPAVDAWLPGPNSIAVGPSGETYIAVSDGQKVMRIDDSGSISVVAGTGVFGFSGDGGLAINARLGNQLGIACDATGNLLIADTRNQRVRKVDAKTGTISTVAGTGVEGYNGDDIQAVEAYFRSPTGVSVDLDGNLFVADQGNNRVRRVDGVTGVITTVAGTGEAGFNGDDIPAIEADLRYPRGVNIDSIGNLWIADTGNSRVRRKDKDSGLIVTVAGTGVTGYNGDDILAIEADLRNVRSVGVDSNGNLFIADAGNHRIRKVDVITLKISTVAGTGVSGYNGDELPATDALLSSPYGLAVVPSGGVMIADDGNDRVRFLNEITGIITTIAGSDPISKPDGVSATATNLRYPGQAISNSEGHVWIADTENNRILILETSTDRISTVAGTGAFGYNGDGIPAIDASLRYPWGICEDQDGNLLISDTGNNRIRQVDAETGVITTIVGTGVRGYAGDDGPGIAAQLSYPTEISVDSSGNLYIADTGNNRIRMVDAASGSISTIAGTGVSGFNGDDILAVDAQLRSPQGVTIDQTGNIYISDTWNHRVRMVDGLSGYISTVSGSGVRGYNGDGIIATNAHLNGPFGVAVDTSAHVFFADTYNGRVRRVDAETGVITTAAGTSFSGYNGDGIPATDAHLNYPWGVDLGPAGEVIVSDSSNHRIRRVIAGPPGPSAMLEVTPILMPWGGDLVLDATGSTSPNGAIVSFAIDALGDGRLTAAASTLTVPWSQFDALGVTPGRYQAMVAIVDEAGRTGTAVVEWTLADLSSETPAGVNSITVAPADLATGELTTHVTYDQVSAAGLTTVETLDAGDLLIEPDQGTGFLLGADTYLEITTTAVFDGLVTVCLSYGETIDEDHLELAHLVELGEAMADGATCEFSGGCWEVVTGAGYPDTEANVICGEVASLSPFLLVNELLVTASSEPVPVGSSIDASAVLPDTVAFSQALFDWGDGWTSEAILDSQTGTYAGVHTYDAPGVYTVRFVVLDGGRTIGSARCQYVVVFDPEGGFVTGGGWFDSPPGAYPADPDLTGHATFGFVSKYVKKDELPHGETEFRFLAAGIKFYSTEHQWMIVAGPKAIFKGDGQLNGEAGFRFLISAIDAELTPSTEIDRFRIKIWNKADGEIAYDNQMGEDDDAPPATEIGGGSIIIRRK